MEHESERVSALLAVRPRCRRCLGFLNARFRFTAFHFGPSSDLESAMQMLIKTFHKYSGKEGDKYTLNRGELKELLLEELGTYLGNSKDNEAVEKVMNDLDANNDGEVDFTEFIILMGALTVACNDFFLEFKTDDKPKGQSS
uniref:Protein S100 n=1 Tax=Takifugu rubripes TaxID=31033 RepID=A0A674NKR2_TAKRU